MAQGTRAPSVASPLGGLFHTWISVLRDPGGFFGSVREPDRLGPPFVFAYAMVSIGWVLVVTLSTVLRTPETVGKLPHYALFMAVRMAELPLLAGFFGGLVIWGIARNYGAPDATYKSAVGLACYSLAVMPIATLVGIPLGSISPQLGGGQIVFLYGFYIVAQGLIVRHRTRPIYTYVVFAFIALFVQGAGYYAMQRAANEVQAEAGQSAPAARE